MKTCSLFLLLAAINACAFAQSYATEDVNVKGWTKDTRIVRSDFKGKPDATLKRLHEQNGLEASAQVGLKSVLDVPKRKRDQGKMLEKVYVAPFFMKNTSVTFTNDEKELDKQRLYFDMGEAIARMMRRDIQHLQDSTKAYGTLWIMYTSIKNYYCEEFGSMFNDYTAEVFGEKREGAYEEWRKLIDEQLSKLEEYATKPEEIHRLITSQPVDPNYEQARTVPGVVIRCQ